MLMMVEQITGTLTFNDFLSLQFIARVPFTFVNLILETSINQVYKHMIKVIKEKNPIGGN